MRIATYNVNSIRIRLHALAALTQRMEPDIICVQETKTEDSTFPYADIHSLGYAHIHHSGQKSYNGVAFLSKIPLSNIHSLDMTGTGHKRHIGATLPDGTVLHNFYVPAGGDLPDPAANPKFADKLAFLDAMTRWALASKNTPMILTGDLNIAPLEHDVWSHRQLLDVVSHTPVETEALGKLQSALAWVDCAREFVPASEKLYSWWSYRNRDWATSNRGRRLDHIWITPSLRARLTATSILKDARSWDNPSDHVPVMADIES